MSPENDCKSFCQLSHGWFYGEPIDASNGKICQVGQGCTRQIGVTKQNGDSSVITKGESYVDAVAKTNTSTHNNDATVSMGLNFDLGIATSENAALERPSRFKFVPALKNLWDATYTKQQQQQWSRAVKEEQSWSVVNQTRFEVVVTESFSESRPAWSNSFCGSWFVVPIVGISCGRGTNGRLAVNKALRETKCFIENPEVDVFSHCFAYTFKDDKQEDLTKYRDVFVLRDCADDFILPGEWQEPAFRHSFSPEVYTRQHIERYGYSNLPLNSPDKPDDASWADDIYGPVPFTKEIGPDLHTLKYCGKGGYCVKHKLTDNNCYNFPRGYSGIKSVDVQEVETTGDNCCTLFSRAECHGQAQNVRGKLTSKMLAAAGFLSQAHSVVCNVNEYCDPDVVDTLE
ncbi:hypothetical protein V8F33_008613 [Rhypophila sp. PSN 637]